MYAANFLNMNLIRFFRAWFLWVFFFLFFFLHENVGLTRGSQLNATDHYGSEASSLQLEMVYITSTNSSKRYLKRQEWRKTQHKSLNMDWQKINLIYEVKTSLTEVSV